MFYPESARVPELLRTDEFLVRPLRSTDVELDYDAVVSSRAELWLASGTSANGPTCSLSRADQIESG
jgi:hypothetical protein